MFVMAPRTHSNQCVEYFCLSFQFCDMMCIRRMIYKDPFKQEPVIVKIPHLTRRRKEFESITDLNLSE